MSKPATEPETKSCFVISPIGEDESAIRTRADQIFKFVITPAATECGFHPDRADKMSEPGMITSQVIQRIVEDPLVIADLTGMNPNVFYELALRHAVRKPLVQLISKGERLPFDVAGMRTITVDNQDLDSVEAAKLDIIKQIKASENKPPQEIESPISVSLELLSLRQSDNPEDKTIANLAASVSTIQRNIDTIGEMLASPEKLLPKDYLAFVMQGEEKSHSLRVDPGHTSNLLDTLAMLNSGIELPDVGKQLVEKAMRISRHIHEDLIRRERTSRNRWG